MMDSGNEVPERAERRAQSLQALSELLDKSLTERGTTVSVGRGRLDISIDTSGGLVGPESREALSQLVQDVL